MCGRFNVTSDPLHQLIVEITGRGFVIDTRFNLAPTEQVPVLLKDSEGQWDLRDMRWWLVPWWSESPAPKYSMFNARSETLTKSRAFRDSFERRRCVLPVTGYYEWRKEGNVKVPYYITPLDQSGFAFAGLWDRWKGQDQVIESCTIVTVAATEAMNPIHNRMPAQLLPEEVHQWLDAEADRDSLLSLLTPRLPEPLLVTTVSTYVNNARNKDERCVEPLGEATVIR